MKSTGLTTILSLLLLACGTPPDEASFASSYGDAFCAQTASCNPELPCSTEVADKSSCAYDAQAAADCLSGAWTCNTEFDGYEFAEPPTACDQVWNCTVASR